MLVIHWCGGGPLSENQEDFGTVPLRHPVLGSSFHFHDELADRLSVPKLPSHSKKGFEPRLPLQGVTVVSEGADQLNDGNPDVPDRQPVVLFIHHALGS